MRHASEKDRFAGSSSEILALIAFGFASVGRRERLLCSL